VFFGVFGNTIGILRMSSLVLQFILLIFHIALTLFSYSSTCWSFHTVFLTIWSHLAP